MSRFLYNYSGDTGCMDTLQVDFSSGPNQIWLSNHSFITPELDSNIVSVQDENYFICSSVQPTTTTTTVKPKKTIKTANNNLSTKKLFITFTDNTFIIISSPSNPIKSTLTNYLTNSVTVTYSNDTVIII